MTASSGSAGWNFGCSSCWDGFAGIEDFNSIPGDCVSSLRGKDRRSPRKMQIAAPEANTVTSRTHILKAPQSLNLPCLPGGNLPNIIGRHIRSPAGIPRWCALVFSFRCCGRNTRAPHLLVNSAIAGKCAGIVIEPVSVVPVSGIYCTGLVYRKYQKLLLHLSCRQKQNSGSKIPDGRKFLTQNSAEFTCTGLVYRLGRKVAYVENS